MIHYNIKFRPYDWDVEVYVIVNNCFIEEILASMKDCPESEIQQAFLNLTTRINSGFIRTFDRRSIIVINKPTTIEEFINVYNHEKNHLEMHICEEFGIVVARPVIVCNCVLSPSTFIDGVTSLPLFVKETFTRSFVVSSFIEVI